MLETRGQTKILILDDSQTFAWVNTSNYGEILVTSRKSHETESILSLGRFRLYEVDNEPSLTDLKHLELHVGNGTWQGYLLPNGLPDEKKKRNRIIPTEEVITKVTV